MPHVLKSKGVEVHIDLPTENYHRSRFDWTGKIVEIKFKEKYLSGIEIANAPKGQFCGKGFYNEFGIESPLGYAETKRGKWFHKIGIGLLKKNDVTYRFYKNYEVTPAKFEWVIGPSAIRITCQSQLVNGYSYYLEKEIKVQAQGFTINYHLTNLGEKPIVTDEYNHNFVCMDHNLIGEDYTLQFPFDLKSTKFEQLVNPEHLVKIGQRDVKFGGTPKEQFFFSNISGGTLVDAAWALENTKSKMGISETGNFQTDKINLWGWTHVISPELFFRIHINPGESVNWTRTYRIYEID